MSNVIAGPTVGSLLARFGAECLKIDMPFPGHDPGLSVMYAIGCNRGKRSMLLDLASPDGGSVLRELVAISDVVVFNGPSRQLRKLGLDAASLAAANPSVVFCRISAYGGPRVGPRSDNPGYDECAQAITGISGRNGGTLQTAEETSTVGLLDNLCGCLGAYAVLLGLMERTHRAGLVEVGTSLVCAADLVQLPFMYDYEGRRPFDEPSGPDAMGEHALYRLYQASDGWLFLGARRDQFASLHRLSKFADLPAVALDLIGTGPTPVDSEAARVQDKELIEALQARFIRHTVGEWVHELRALGIGICAVRGYDQLVKENLIPKADGC